jgi:hypothetical protein
MVLLLWLAAIGHLLVMITRSAALIVLAAVTPAAAAGLVSDAGRTWFWKEPALVSGRRLHPGADGADAGHRGAAHHRRRQRSG